MRTTITLDPDTEALVRRTMREKSLSFKQAVNAAIREGLAGGGPVEFRTPTFKMGKPKLSLTKALSLAADLEDEEISRKLTARK